MALLDSTTTTAATSDVGRLEHLLRRNSDVAFVLFADKPQRDGPVLGAVDESPGSRSAARIAKTVADDLDAELALVHVPRPRRRQSSSAEVRSRRRAHDRIRANARRVTGHEQIATVAGEGSDEERLLRFARARGARLLVTHLGDQGLNGWLAEGMAETASSPVVLVAEARHAVDSGLAGAHALPPDHVRPPVRASRLPPG
jgi:nucleotide-binding universal stress UspA family protein